MFLKYGFCSLFQHKIWIKRLYHEVVKNNLRIVENARGRLRLPGWFYFSSNGFIYYEFNYAGSGDDYALC